MSTDREPDSATHGTPEEGGPPVPLPADRTPVKASNPLLRGDPALQPPSEVRLLSAGVGLARLTVGASWRIGGWALGASMRVGNRVLRAAVQGENAQTLLENASDELRDQARELLGIVDAGRIVGYRQAPRRQLEQSVRTADLRERGAALLDASADVNYAEPYHPAYARILDDLAPDEARILRLLATEGPHAMVDVRRAVGLVGATELVAENLTMIGAHAGCRFMDRVPAYLTNLERLGLILFSDEELKDHMAYQVLEAQPAVQEAIAAAGRAKTVRRSARMTPFGEEFVRTCLPLDQPSADPGERE